MPERHVVHDPQVLRAIAHPVRNRILNEIEAHGSMRAADIARELGIPANQASFHLRQLAKYGLVEEDPAAARDRRDRVWRTAVDGAITINIEDVERSPGGPAAARVFRRNAQAWGQAVVASAYGDARAEGQHRSITDSSLRLTQDEARELSAELGEVVDRWAQRTRGDGGERTTYLYYGMLVPYPDLPGSGS